MRKIYRSAATEFPNFDTRTIPALFAGAEWQDTSWHNNTCPSFHNSTLKVTVFVDYPNPADREWDAPRFTLYAEDEIEMSEEPMLSTDSVDAIAEAVQLAAQVAGHIHATK